MAGRPKKASKGNTWDEYSRYIRIRRCIETTRLPFVGICVTCDRRFHIAALQAGHYPEFAGGTNIKKFLTKFIFLQCTFCNLINHGEKKKYAKKMVKLYGQDYIDKIKRYAHKPVQLDYERLRTAYNRKTKELLSKYGYGSWDQMLGMNKG